MQGDRLAKPSRSVLWTFCFLATILTAGKLFAANPSALQIYVIDVEGGQATLFVAPNGESLLIDTGWPGFNGRDADRIVQSAKSAGVSKLDYVLITHYHRDHVGGVPQLAQRMKIGAFIDHGPNLEHAANPREDYAAYEKVIDGTKRILAKPGEKISLGDAEVEIITAAGERIQQPLQGIAVGNSLCVAEPTNDVDRSENARSVGVLITYGNIRILDLGDLTKKKELELVCPKNLIGTIDLFIVDHHGYEESNPKAFVDAIRPRVAIMDNGAKKGASPSAWTTLRSAPDLEDLWQSHYAVEGGKDHNVTPDFIANPEGSAGTGEDEGHAIHVTARSDGSMTVTNERNKFTKTYAPSASSVKGHAH
jgi:beta-lactamase superfamily II metal-dependent hydrolase